VCGMMKTFTWLIAVVALFQVVTVMAENWPYTCVVKGSDVISDNSTTTTKCSASGASEDEAKAAAFCHQPNYNEANNTFSEYGCGVCPDAAENGTCLSCAAWNGTSGADNSNCNSYHPPIFTYSCYQAGSSVKCSNGSLLQDIHCWGPKASYKENNANLTVCGCGSCEAAHSSDATWKLEDCKTCDYENCNGAEGTILILAPTVAFFWFYVYSY